MKFTIYLLVVLAIMTITSIVCGARYNLPELCAVGIVTGCAALWILGEEMLAADESCG